RAGGAEAGDGLRPRGQLPEAPLRGGALQLVGLPDARVPEEPRAPAGPRLRHTAADRAAAGGWHRPGGAEGEAPFGPRPRLGPLQAARRPGPPERPVRLNRPAGCSVQGVQAGDASPAPARCCAMASRALPLAVLLLGAGCAHAPAQTAPAPDWGIARASTVDTFEIGGQADHWGVRVTDDQMYAIQPDFALARTGGEIRGRANGVPVVVAFQAD